MTKPESDKTIDQEAQNAAPNGAEAPSGVDLEALTALVKEKENKYLYLYADFENFKKRAAKERQDLVQYGWERVARDFLGILDNLDRAFQHSKNLGSKASECKGLIDGIEMVIRQFSTTLEQNGVRRIDALGKPFDPLFMKPSCRKPRSSPPEQSFRSRPPDTPFIKDFCAPVESL